MTLYLHLYISLFVWVCVFSYFVLSVHQCIFPFTSLSIFLSCLYLSIFSLFDVFLSLSCLRLSIYLSFFQSECVSILILSLTVLPFTSLYILCISVHITTFNLFTYISIHNLSSSFSFRSFLSLFLSCLHLPIYSLFACLSNLIFLSREDKVKTRSYASLF